VTTEAEGLPVGYAPWSTGAARGFALEEAGAWVASVTAGAATLHEWASLQTVVRELRGRGTVYAIRAPLPGPDGRKEWAVKRYRRGGMLARALGDRYLVASSTRPSRELRASVEARARGVRTPAIVAGAVYRAGWIYRADLVTELVPDATSLAATLFASDAAPGRSLCLSAVGRLVYTLEQRGILHADLNAGNVLTSGTGGQLEAHVIDLDRCVVLPEGARPPVGPMRRRLERSLSKLAKAHGRPLAPEEWTALRTGFEGAR
jgi:3-deoxy-D-manno-octulosonic acid kinase